MKDNSIKVRNTVQEHIVIKMEINISENILLDINLAKEF
jgi:hypothetical protein